MRTALSSPGSLEELLFLAGAGFGDVQGRINSLIGQVPVERQLHVASALELFEDDLIHSAAGVDQAGCQNGEAAAVFDFSGGSEEAFGDFEGAVIEAAGESDAPRRRGRRC